MIEVNYNEYKETIAENMRLIRINHDLKETIKEAREWVYKMQQDNKRLEPTISTDELDGILQILDKEEIK